MAATTTSSLTVPTLIAAVGALAALLTSITGIALLVRVYWKVNGLASAQAERIDQLSGVIAEAPHVQLPDRLPSGESVPEPPPKADTPFDAGPSHD